MARKNLVYWIERDGRWVSVFITTSNLPRNGLGDIIGEIYNMRRKYSHKRLRLCWKNLREKSANDFKKIDMWPEKLAEKYGVLNTKYELIFFDYEIDLLRTLFRKDRKGYFYADRTAFRDRI